MSDFAVKGWCPDAWRPMQAGDGLLVRIKPRLGRLTRARLLGLCDAAATYGSGLIDMTRRANLQLRGVGEQGWRPLVDRLIALDLVDADASREQRRNLLVAPDWRAGDDSHRIASALLARLDELPDLPGKAGFVVDAGPAPILSGEPGDFRIERGSDERLILRGDGRTAGVAVPFGEEADALIALARWFVDSGGTAVGRMVRHKAPLPVWADEAMLPASAAAPIAPGPHGSAMAYGLPFGRIDARLLTRAIEESSADAVRITPWRVLLLEGADGGRVAGLIDDPADPLLHVDACPGAPACPQSTVATRDLARRLAPYVEGSLHVSGCAKGCAHAGPADVTLTGRDGLFDLGFDAPAGGASARAALTPARILAHFGIS